MKIVSFQQIADSLHISKQAVDIQFVRKGYLAKNKFGKIDIDDPDNRLFLESKGADFSVFYADKTQKVIQKPVEMALKPDNIPVKGSRFETNNEMSKQQMLDMKIKLQTLKHKEAETELKKIKIEEANARLIPRDFTERLVNDTVGAIQQTFLVIPSSIIDILFNIYENHPEDRREQIVKLLQEKYTKETKKTVQKAYNRFRKAIKEQIEKADEKPES